MFTTTLSFSDTLLLAACFLWPENMSPCRAGSQQVALGWQHKCQVLGTEQDGPGKGSGGFGLDCCLDGHGEQ